ncbi:MAG: helical backbone metal receptor [Gemmatimonadaceae bacterium]
MPALRLRPLALALFTAAVLGCADRAASAGSGSADDFGAPLEHAAGAAPTRIVSLNPTTTELLFALGAGARLVGRSHWDEWPDSARLVPDVGPGLRPNIEAVLARRPDLVLLYAGDDNRVAADRLRGAGVRTIALKVDRIADFRRAVELLGTAVGTERAAARVIAAVDADLARVRDGVAGRQRSRVFWHVWDKPVITIGRGSYLHELVEIAGGVNVYADMLAPSPQVSLEDVARRDPQWILAGPVGAATIARDPAWRAIRAVREGRILIVDTALVGRPSVKMGAAARSLARLLHPETGL